MFDVFLDYVKKLLKSRLFPIAIIYLVLFCMLIGTLFNLQIVQGPVLAKSLDLKETKTREIKSTRGNIYDRNGVLLASNTLSYSVTMEDSTKITSNEQRNAVIYRLVKLIEANGDTLDNEFYIKENKNGELEFTVTGAALTRFIGKAFEYLKENGALPEDKKDATAQEVYDFLKNGTDKYPMFGISDDYSVEDILKIMGIRYALFCNYPKFLQITVASHVSDTTVAAVKESSAELPGVSIQQETQRIYNNSIYFAHILGYTGLISSDELEAMNAENPDYYDSSDIIGKTGLEKQYESYLAGKKGSEVVTVNAADKVVGVEEKTDPMAGGDLYITIDSDLQISVYHILEKEIAGILISKLRPDMNYGTKGESASDILTPIYEVYNALINNNIIDINHFTARNATALETSVYEKYKAYLKDVFNKYDKYLAYDNTVPNDKTGDMEDFLNYFHDVLIDKKILLKDNIPEDDATYRSYLTNKTSLSSFLKYALSNNWIDLSQLKVGDEYNTVQELYGKLIEYIENDVLKLDTEFSKMIYHNLIFSYKLSGTEICLLLFDQNVLKSNEDDINRLKNGVYSPYQFIVDKMKHLEITPAMLALPPYSGSVVITDVKTGDVLAMVTYPSYDNNLLANKIDADYWAKLNADAAKPLNDRPVTDALAPGSTFKGITSVAALEEGVVTTSERILDLGIFDEVFPPAKCNIYPGSHGSVNISDALKVSCNYFFYEMGYRLSTESSGRYNEKLGIKRLQKYAEMFGLNAKSGVEVYEKAPHISDKDPIRTAIGQSTNAFTPVQMARYITTVADRGTVYNLTLIDKILDKSGNVILDNKASVYNKLTDIKSSTWDAVQQGMYEVVNESGGSVYDTFKDLGVTVAGKTGTSQISKVVPNNALFISYAPYEDPKIAVAVVIPQGHTSGNAAELARDIYKLYFHLGDKDKLIDNNVTLPENNMGAFAD